MKSEFPIHEPFCVCVETQDDLDALTNVFDRYDIRWASGDKFSDLNYFHHDRIYYDFDGECVTWRSNANPFAFAFAFTTNEFLEEIQMVESIGNIELSDSISIDEML